MLGRRNVVRKLTLAAALAVSCVLAAPAGVAAARGGVSSRGHGGGGHSGGGHGGGGHVGGSHHFGGSSRHHWGGGWGYRPYWGSSWWWGWPYYDTWGPRVYVYSGGYRVATSSYAAVKTDVEPDEAEVWLDGKYIGTADDFDGFPDFLYLEPGAYHLEFRLPGHKTYAVDVDVHRGERLKIDRHLERESGHGRLDSFLPPSKGMPHGRVYGKSGPVTPQSPEVRERPRPSVRDDDVDDDDDDRTDVREEPRAERPREVRPPARHEERSRIRWSVEPEDAAVYLDDAYVGTGEDLSGSHRGTFAEPGKHTVTVLRPGFQQRTVTVEVKPGEPLDVVVKLSK